LLKEVLIYGGLAGLAIPIGALLSRIRLARSQWVASEIRHAILAFGAGALLAAIALVLVPEGIDNLSLSALSIAFFGGGLLFAWLDRYLAQKTTPLGQFVAMLSDFIPECLALGALFIADPAGARLLAVLISLQNAPEAFNAYREITSGGSKAPVKALIAFALLAPVGPISAYIGLTYLADPPEIIAAIMTFAAGGIMYLMFQEIAPKVMLKNSWLPPMGALAGFFVGVFGTVVVG